LLHGFGFAGALSELELTRQTLAASLVGFNLGVEIGQLAIVAVVVPLAFVLRRTVFYERVVLRFGSLGVVALAGAWLLERAFDLRL
jgi:HupE / UreJ protein